MVDLRVLLNELKFRNVVTYIQSGNIVLDSDLSEQQEIEKMIHLAINSKFGYDVNVLALTRSALLQVFKNNPFLKSKDVKKLAATLLNTEPDLTHLDYLKEKAALNEDEFIVDGKCLYMQYPNGQGRSKLTHAMLEKKTEFKSNFQKLEYNHQTYSTKRQVN